MKNKGFINILILAITGFTLLGIVILHLGDSPKISEQNFGAQVFTVRMGGTGEDSFASTTLVAANGTDKLTGTSTPTFSQFHATSTTATSSIRFGLTLGDLFVTAVGGVRIADLASCDTIDTDSAGVLSCGSDATGAAATTDLQDVYNNSEIDAQITTANAKDIIFYLQDTVTDPLFQIFSAPDGQGRLEIGTSDGTATTTTAVWETYGALGIGTTSPGAAFAVNASTTILGNNAYLFGPLTLNYFNATSTTATSTIIAGLNAGYILQTPFLDVGKLIATSTNVGTSSIPFLESKYIINAETLMGGYLKATGTIEIAGTATSTFQGGLRVVSAGGLASAQGLTITGGHIQSAGKLIITDAASSSIAGVLAITGTASSSIAGDLLLSKPLIIDGGGARNETIVVTDEATMKIDGALGTKFTLTPTADRAVSFINFGAGQTAWLLIYLTNNQTTLSFPSSSPALYESAASTTIRNLTEGFNVCGFTFATSTATAFGGCNIEFEGFR